MAKKRKKKASAEYKPSAYWENLEKFLNHLEGARKSIFLSAGIFSLLFEKEDQKVREFIKDKGKNVKETQGTLHYGVEPHHSNALDKLEREAEASRAALRIIPRSIFCLNG